MKIPFFWEEDDPELREYLIAANPHLYDYAHFIAFKKDEVEFIDGAGQLLNLQAKGKYKIYISDNSNAEILFYNLIEIDPYDEKEITGEVESINVKVHREQGIFPFLEENSIKYKDENEHPCLLYNCRYVFDSDPLSIAVEQQKNNLYNIMEDVTAESLLYYYPLPEREKLPLKELLSRGITKDQFLK